MTLTPDMMLGLGRLHALFAAALYACGGTPSPRLDLAGEDSDARPSDGSDGSDGAEHSGNDASISTGDDSARPDGADASDHPGDGGLATYSSLAFADIGQPTEIGASQFYFSEGPVWDPSKNVLYFTDINARQNGVTGGAIYVLTLPNTLQIVLQPSGNADGLGLRRDAGARPVFVRRRDLLHGNRGQYTR
jgi:hypothetical protein